MIHTIKIDDSTPLGKQLLSNLKSYKEVVFEDNITSEPTQTYLSGADFEKKVIERLEKRIHFINNANNQLSSSEQGNLKGVSLDLLKTLINNQFKSTYGVDYDAI